MPIGVIPGRGSKPADIVAVATFCTDRDYGFRTTATRVGDEQIESSPSGQKVTSRGCLGGSPGRPRAARI
jgi:hypothetical protein